MAMESFSNSDSSSWASSSDGYLCHQSNGLDPSTSFEAFTLPLQSSSLPNRQRDCGPFSRNGGAAAAAAAVAGSSDAPPLHAPDCSSWLDIELQSGLLQIQRSAEMDVEFSQPDLIWDRQARDQDASKPYHKQQQRGQPQLQQQHSMEHDTAGAAVRYYQSRAAAVNLNAQQQQHLDPQQQQEYKQESKEDVAYVYEQLELGYDSSWMGRSRWPRQSSSAGHRAEVAASSRDNQQAIMTHLRLRELQNRPNPHYMSTIQASITPNMRYTLVDWLVGVCQDLNLTSETLFLTVQLLDRSLSFQEVTSNTFQLLGVSCLWIAAKFEEVDAPSCAELVNCCYGEREIVQMEQQVLMVLGYTLASPTAKTFQRRYLQTAAADGLQPQQQQQLHYLAAFVLELSLLDCSFLRYLPSQLAAGSVYLARVMLGYNPWTQGLAQCSGYEHGELGFIAYELALYHARILGAKGFTNQQQLGSGHHQAGCHISSNTSSSEMGSDRGLKKKEYCTIVDKFRSKKVLCVACLPSGLQQLQEMLWPGSSSSH